MPKILTLVLLLGFVSFSAWEISAQTTELTYQGSLKDGAATANGTYDFEFALFDLLSAGNQIGATIPRNGVSVSNGIFTVKLDFGSVFPGANRFLEIRVRLAGQPGITTLAPRQAVNSAPYSVKSLNTDTATTATNATQLGGVAANQFVVTTDPRMTDARPPTAGSPDYIQNQNSATQLSSNFDISGTGKANAFNASTQYNIAGQRVFSINGTNNLFVGANTGTAMDAAAVQDIFVGPDAGAANTTGNANTFVGAFAGAANTVGNFNSIFGSFAGNATSVGNHNSYFGQASGRISTGSSNSFFGSATAFNNTVGFNNAFFGSGAGQGNIDGNDNTFLGRGAGIGNSSGNSNVFVGFSAGSFNNLGSNNTAIGRNAQISSAAPLTFATAIGAEAFVNSSNTLVLGRAADTVQIPGSLAIAGTFTAAGTLTGNLVNTVTQYNLNGSRVLASPGNGNIFVGNSAGLSGANNSIFGAGSGDLTTGNNNAFFGFAAGDDNVAGNANSFFGLGAGAGNVSGSTNAFFGMNSGNSNIDGSDNTALGYDANVGAGNLINATAIGAKAFVSQNNSLILGSINGVNGATTNTRVGIGTTAPERPLHVRGTGAQEIMIESADVGGNKWTVQSGGAGQNGRFEIIDRTATSSKMTILPTGEVGIGTTGPTSLLTVGLPEATTVAGRVGIFNSTGFNLVLRDTTNDVEGFMGLNSGNGVFVGSASNHQLQFRTNNTSRMIISTAGLVSIPNLVAAAATTTLCHNASNQIGACTASSLRYKTNIAPFSPGLDFVNRLRPISYDWKDGGVKDIGFGAEDIAKIDTRFVTLNAAGEVEGVKYDRLSVAFVNAFKEQQTQIEAQQKRIERQQAEIDDLKRIVCLIKPEEKICQE